MEIVKYPVSVLLVDIIVDPLEPLLGLTQGTTVTHQKEANSRHWPIFKLAADSVSTYTMSLAFLL